MLRVSQILASRLALAASLAALVTAAGCGQRGPLFLPGDPAASARATLPQTLRSGLALGVPDRPSGAAPAAVMAPAAPGAATTPALTAPFSGALVVPGAAAPVPLAPASVRPPVPATP